MNKEQNELLESVNAANEAAELELESALNEVEEQGMTKIEVYVEDEKQGFWKEHGNTAAKAGAGVAAIAGAFTGGFFTGKHVEKKKRKLFMDEINKQIALMVSANEGLKTIPWNGEETPTEGYDAKRITEMRDVITERFLKDTKIKDEERNEWIDLVLDLTQLGVIARDNQFVADNEIVIEDEQADK